MSYPLFLVRRNLIYFVFLFSILGCDKSYFVKGTILEIRSKSNSFLIHHDEIPGYMIAMTMPFILKDSTDINKFSIGDSIHFYLTMSNNKALASDFTLKGKGTITDNDEIWDDEFSPLNIGEIFDNTSFLDIDSNIVSLSDSDGKFRFISYIFTRCPIPNMCPAVIVKNQYLAKTFSNNSKIEFILISFDYNFDTPSIINSNYGSISNSNTNIKFLSSSGHINDIYTLAGQSNISFWGIEENDIGHTLRSIIIDPERRLMKAYEGTEWQPEKAERDIRNLLEAYNF